MVPGRLPALAFRLLAAANLPEEVHQNVRCLQPQGSRASRVARLCVQAAEGEGRPAPSWAVCCRCPGVCGRWRPCHPTPTAQRRWYQQCHAASHAVAAAAAARLLPPQPALVAAPAAAPHPPSGCRAWCPAASRSLSRPPRPPCPPGPRPGQGGEGGPTVTSRTQASGSGGGGSAGRRGQAGRGCGSVMLTSLLTPLRQPCVAAEGGGRQAQAAVARGGRCARSACGAIWKP